jgi:hypothetical protein
MRRKRSIARSRRRKGRYNDIDGFLALVKSDRKNKKTPEEAYLEKFGIKPAAGF